MARQFKNNYEEMQFWRRAYDRAMQSYVEMTFERDDARRCAKAWKAAAKQNRIDFKLAVKVIGEMG
jgi:hypothetical protein